ncbi:MAG TPA: beta-propeller fold lactonase family protein [Gaiellaceae bacterium]|nr:beta-propeller fold lactonase family protein [Gaiellaceae bacterium]
MNTDAVFTQSNEAGGNRVIAFHRSVDGELSEPVSVATGGLGDGVPHLTSQGSVGLTSDGRLLLVTNAGSDDVTVLTVDGPSVVSRIPSGGSAPKSVAEHEGLVYVLNTGDRSVTGFRLSVDTLEPLEGSRRELGTQADPAQVGFTPDGSTLVVTDRAANAILLFAVGADGLLGMPHTVESAGPTPYGFAFAGGNTLVVTEAFGAQTGKAAASSYRVDGTRATAVSRSVGNGRSEICWAVVSKDGRHVFTTNFADGAVSRYAVSDDGTLELEDAVAATAVDGEPGLRDEGLSADGRFLYAIDAEGGRVFGWTVENGKLTAVGSWNGLPRTVAGLAAS